MLDKAREKQQYTATMLTRLSLHQFRSYGDLTLTFDPEIRINAFIGPNTAGKTNILEAMYFLCLLKSFRTHLTSEMVQWGGHVLRVTGEFDDGTSLGVGVATRPKKQRHYTINDREAAVEEYVGTKTVVFFSPDDISMLLASPANRRRYMDVILCQTDSTYLRTFATYGKCLKQRNSLLRTAQREESARLQLSYWDDHMAGLIPYLMEAREKLLLTMNRALPAHYASIAGHAADVEAEYLPSLPQGAQREEVQAALQAHRERDILLGSTSIGPHRDDLRFRLGDRSVESFASRGDTRSFVLGLKLGELAYILETTGDAPLLLMDDVFSELDVERQQRLLAHLPSTVQTFFTTTHIPEQLDTTHFPIHVIAVDAAKK